MRRVLAFVILSSALAGASSLAQQPLPPQPIMQPAQHRCELSPDRRIVSLMVSNPSAQPTECSVNCWLPYKGGQATVTCTKVVPANAAQFPLCAHSRDNDGQYAKLERSTGLCSVTPAPAAPTVTLKPGETVVRFKDPESMTQEERLQDFTRGMGRKF